MKPNEVNMALASEQIDRARQDLWEVQLQEYPDSVRMTANEVVDRAYENPGFAKHAALAMVEDPIGFFYKCGLRDGSYRWVGFRFGVEPQDFRSGFDPL